jgi:hypothetical protein
MPTAYTEATEKPTTRTAAISMCTTSAAVDGLNIAATGWAATTCPFSSRNPVGVFIQAFAATTKNAPAMPDSRIGTPESMCARGDKRSQPNR